MQGRSVTPESSTVNAAISACGRGSQWEASLALIAVMGNRQLYPDNITCHAAASACERARRWTLALAVLEQMERFGVQSDAVTYGCAISACERGRKWEEAICFIGDMQLRRITANVIVYNALVSCCATGHAWEAALSLLGDATPSVTVRGGSSSPPDVVIYNTVIAACAGGEAWETALQVLESARRCTSVDVVTCTAAIAACSRARRWQAALALFCDMRHCLLRPNEVSFAAVLAPCSLDGGDAAWQASASRLPGLSSPASVALSGRPPTVFASFSGFGKGVDAFLWRSLPRPPVEKSAALGCLFGQGDSVGETGRLKIGQTSTSKHEFDHAGSSGLLDINGTVGHDGCVGFASSLKVAAEIDVDVARSALNAIGLSVAFPRRRWSGITRIAAVRFASTFTLPSRCHRRACRAALVLDCSFRQSRPCSSAMTTASECLSTSRGNFAGRKAK
eukprot:TRINITY_DN73926_c0_g1_i1.p1 TRINITY_DN73926_c0_g1~~TRINITY_DN73926_c0_g1_i1.p1  ORF type:complete len:520 (-),score=50.25 TRINITY_DN73926_c0_g1_i1:21-1373(-)